MCGDPGVPNDDGNGDMEDGEVGGGPAQFGVSGDETEYNGSVSHSSTAGGDRGCALRLVTEEAAVRRELVALAPRGRC